MALWHFLDKNGKGFAWDESGATVSSFDDGADYLPSEPEFSRESADAKAVALGKGITAEYSGTPGYHARIEREQEAAATRVVQQREKEAAAARKARAEAELDAMLNPPTVADEVNARFNAMLAMLPDRGEDIEKLRKAALEESQEG